MPGNKKKRSKKSRQARRRPDVPVHRNRKVLKSTKQTWNAWLLSPDRMRTKVELARVRRPHCTDCCHGRRPRRGGLGGGAAGRRWPWAVGTAGVALAGSQWEPALRLLAAATGA